MSSKFLDKYMSKTLAGGKTKNPKTATHIFLNGKNIEEIGDLSLCPKTKVLYLFDNKIAKIINIENLENLTQLHLQWNNLTAIENLNSLANLKKLYLGYNKITCLENIEKLHNLEELHLERQDITDEFRFDLDSILGISHSLRVLNITKLNLKNIDILCHLAKLKILKASENDFKDAEDLGKVLRNLPLLRKVDFYNSPAQRDTYYRDKIISGSINLEYLDNKYITLHNRSFIKNFERIKLEKKSQIVLEANKTSHDDKGHTKSNNNSAKALRSVHFFPSVSGDEHFKTWNSLKYLNKPKKHNSVRRREHQTKNVGEYALQGKNITT